MNIPVPIAGATEFAQLSENDTTMFVPPQGGVVEKVFTAQFFSRPSFFAQRLFDFGLLRSN